MFFNQAKTLLSYAMGPRHAGAWGALIVAVGLGAACNDETRTRDVIPSILTVEKVQQPDAYRYNARTVTATYKRHDPRAAAGRDQAYITADDDLVSYHTFETNTDRATFNYFQTEAMDLTTYYLPQGSGIGVDGDWFSDDDVIGSYLLEVISQDQQVFRIRYEGAGLDGIWFSADDSISVYTRRRTIHEEDVTKTYVSRYDSAGNDQQWFSEDDKLVDQGEIGNFSMPDENGQYINIFWVVSEESFYSSEPWGMHRLVEEYVDGRTVVTEYSGLGSDSLKFTYDDVVFSRLSIGAPINLSDGGFKKIVEITLYDKNGVLEEHSQFQTEFYDNQGTLVKEVVYGDPGTDLLWGTEDDVVRSYFQRTVVGGSGQGQRVEGTYYWGAGEDDERFTEDDAKIQSTAKEIVPAHDREVTTTQTYWNSVVGETGSNNQLSLIREETHIRLF